MSSKRKADESSLSTNNKKSRTSKGISENDIETEAKKVDFFAGLSFYILKAGIEKARIEIFQNQIRQNGGKIENTFSSSGNVSHIIVDDKMETARMLRLLDLSSFPDIIVAKTQWISLCLKNKRLVESDAYRLKPEIQNSSKYEESECNDEQSQRVQESGENSNARDSTAASSHANNSTLLPRSGIRNTQMHFQPKLQSPDTDSDSDASNEDGHCALPSYENVNRKEIRVDTWVCAQSSKGPMQNHNKHITDKLEEMVKAYNSTNDKWRSYGYQKCIRALMKQPKVISSWEEAKALPGVGSRLADKIWEIAQSGELRKLNEFKSSEEVKTLEMFNNVWGAGPHTAQVWFQQGFRTIDDLRTKAKLTSQQKVGVRLYEDILDRMPREEAGQIAEVVREAAESIQPGIIAQACGSYRRGKVTCGDVDILVTHPDGKSHKGVFAKLLDKLHVSGFLTDDLVSAEENGNQKKYLGVCKLPGENTKHRRLDIIIVPYHEYACAVVYFTGSAHFNRSLRLLCKKQDMSLSEHALRQGVVRHGGERVHEGSIIPTPTEESLFKVLKIPYRPPEERDH